MLRQLPHPQSRLHDLIFRGRFVHHIRHPSVPAGLELRGVELFVLVGDPARADYGGECVLAERLL